MEFKLGIRMVVLTLKGSLTSLYLHLSNLALQTNILNGEVEGIIKTVNRRT